MFAREREFDSQVWAAAQSMTVPLAHRATFPALIKAVMAAESAFNPAAYRAEPQIADASRGLMQVLERTARSLGYTAPVGNDSTRTGGLYDPMTSTYLGAKLLAQNLTIARGSDPDIAISAYNAGWSPSRAGDAKRTSTGAFVNQPYVDRVKGYWRYFQGQPLVVQQGTGAVPPQPTASPQESGTVAVVTWVGLALVALLYWLRRAIVP